jgi:hypothetical protein
MVKGVDRGGANTDQREGGAGLVPLPLGIRTCGRRLPFVATQPWPASRQRGVGQARRCIAGLSVRLGEVSTLCRRTRPA